MKIKPVISYLILLACSLQCSSSSPPAIQDVTDQEDARLNAFDGLERSILKITCSAFYENYYFAPPSPEQPNVSQQSLLINKKLTTNSVAGTGLIILEHANKILLLTCFHVFDFEDTVKTYYLNKNKKPTPFLQSLSIKYGQIVYVSHKNGSNSQGKILAFDKENDIAIIEADDVANDLAESPFRAYFPAKTDIKFGKEIYILGFPKGMFLITKGLASPSKYKNKFITDISFNKGFSGGIVIAFDRKSSDYTYLGMANATAYDSQTILIPSESIQDLSYYRDFPYKDDVYVGELRMINYGITFVLKSEAIYDFLKRETNKLKQYGYYSIDKLLN
ncbi:serine protease [candidate division KSB1 bacterium]|nr:serine protease [candidate division KSB1 bacterium]